MWRQPFVIISLLSVVLLTLGIYLTPDVKDPPLQDAYPWHIRKNPDGTTRVFGITPTITTLHELELRFKQPAEVTLFVSANGKRVLEAFFSSINLNGLYAKLVLSFDTDKPTLDRLYQHGERISKLPSGDRKVTLTDAGKKLVESMPVASVTYMSSVKLDEKVLESRFGKPQKQIKDPESSAVHWLYPDKGVDIAVDPDAGLVIQYVQPQDFGRVSQPLNQ